MTGDVANLFGTYSEELNRKIVEKSFDESSSQFTVSEEGRRATWQYAALISCFKASN